MTAPHLSNHQDAGGDQATNGPPPQPSRATATLAPSLPGNSQVVSHVHHPVSFFQQDSIGLGLGLDPAASQYLQAPLLANVNGGQLVPDEAVLAMQAPVFRYPCQAPGYPVFDTWGSGPYEIPLQSQSAHSTAGLLLQSQPAHPNARLPLQSQPVYPAAFSSFNLVHSTKVNYDIQQLQLANADQSPFPYQPGIHLPQSFTSDATAQIDPTLGSFAPLDPVSEPSWAVSEQSSDSVSPEPLPLLCNTIIDLPLRCPNPLPDNTHESIGLDILDSWDSITNIPIAPLDIQAFLPAHSQHSADQSPTLQPHPCIDADQSDTGQIPEVESEQMERVRHHRKAIKRGPGVSKRRRFADEKTKEETRLTRMAKACMRCRLYRIRCFPDGDDLTKPCLTCQTSSPSRLACIRYKVTDISLFRLGPSEDFVWSRRWLGKGLQEIATWQSKQVKWIKLTQGYGNASITISVKRFVPLPTDILSYKWEAPDGENKSLECAPYALANIEKVTSELQRHIKDNVIQHISALTEHKAPILGRTLTLILSLINQAQFPPKQTELLQETLYIWVATRLIEKPWRVSNNEMLEHDISDNTHPFWDNTSPYHFRIPVTPVMDNQLDQVVIKRILTPLSSSVMKRLRTLIEANKPANWFVIYLCTFILLNNYELATVHDRSFALRYSLKSRFSNYPLLEGFHAGAKTLLAHFHYCCKGHALFQLDWTRRREIEPIKSSVLNKDQERYLSDLRSAIAMKGTSSFAMSPKPLSPTK
ncbi:hypothetical protein QQX98_011628 [Neonectria punicea]|uniref:Zn(2)-C6 fungal-type domain-containing protein n=1 Tax=Neonectria punicea TaxID=979145 RepID=A0ABR1GL48_9HYPO